MAYPRRSPSLAPPKPSFLADENPHSSSGSSIDASSLDPASDSDSPAIQPRVYRRRRSLNYAPEQTSDAGSWSPSVLYAETTTPVLSPQLSPTRPPPSSFAFPFQAYPGNPDPIPARRRTSIESTASRTAEDHDYAQYIQLEPTPGTLPLRKPFAPFMANSSADATGGSTSSLPRSPSSSSLYKQSAAANMMPVADGLPRNSSTHSFRAPFLSPASRPSSIWAPPSYGHPSAASPFASTTALPIGVPMPLSSLKTRTPLPSTRLSAPLTKADKPWLTSRPPRSRLSYFITLLCIIGGLAGAALLCFTGIQSVPLLNPNSLCLVLEEDFTGSSLDTGTWTRDVELGGFGNGEFQMTTNSDDNLYIQNGELFFMPTLTPSNIASNGNYTLPGCTATLTDGKTTNTSACSVHISGDTIINPVQSARINTKGKKSIKYGKVEVIAKMPTGDWLWPAIWMLPENATYGAWPLSGEIDLVEARGNGPTYPRQGNNFVRATLNYGPVPGLVEQIFGWYSLKRSSFASSFHTYTLEWTEDFIRASVDARTHTMLLTQTKSDKSSYFNKAGFPATATNASSGAVVAVENAWSSGTRAAPFDQDFYLIMDLAVGGTSGWFPDNVGNKPWFDGSLTAMRDFANAKDSWFPTWPQSADDLAMRVDSVKMWEVCR